jgi:hypothetical protein
VPSVQKRPRAYPRGRAIGKRISLRVGLRSIGRWICRFSAATTRVQTEYHDQIIETVSHSGWIRLDLNLHGLLRRAGARQIIVIRARHEAASKTIAVGALATVLHDASNRHRPFACRAAVVGITGGFRGTKSSGRGQAQGQATNKQQALFRKHGSHRHLLTSSPRI